jgi:hypothetical protein
VQPFIEISDTIARDAATRAMQHAGVHFVRIVHVDEEWVKTAVVAEDELNSLEDANSTLTSTLAASPAELFIDWRQLLTDSVTNLLEDAPTRRTVTIEDEGSSLGILPIKTIEAFLADAPRTTQ